MVDDEKSLQESVASYGVEPQVKVHIPLSALLEAIGSLSEDGLRQVWHWVNERLADLSAEMPGREGKPGQTLTRFAGWIPQDDLALMRDAIESGCEVIDTDERDAYS